jgi:hypothetical protein
LGKRRKIQRWDWEEGTPHALAPVSVCASSATAPGAPRAERGSAGSGSRTSNGNVPILVTGMPRSGTTWLAQMLEHSGDAVYINEPLNRQDLPGRSPGLFHAPVHHGFQYICDDNEAEYLDAYRELIRFRYRPLDDLRTHRKPRDIAQVVRHTVRFRTARLNRKRALVADPYAVFSADWLARRLGFRVVVIVRDPAAVISSRLRLRWGLKVPQQLLSQPLLVRDRLGPFRSDLEDALTEPGDRVDSNCLLWRLIYAWVAELSTSRDDVVVVRHEDLSRDPPRELERLYGRLELRFSEASRQAIERATRPGNPRQLDPDKPHSVTLDSRANVDAWRSRLAPEDLRRIRSLTRDVARQYYTAEELAID